VSTNFRPIDIHSEDPAKVLGVEPLFDEATLRRRYLELVKQYPPETSSVEFNAIHKAYEKLSNPIEGWCDVLRVVSFDSIATHLQNAPYVVQRLPTQFLLDLGAR
jgi:hypothetical protein